MSQWAPLYLNLSTWCMYIIMFYVDEISECIVFINKWRNELTMVAKQSKPNHKAKVINIFGSHRKQSDYVQS